MRLGNVLRKWRLMTEKSVRDVAKEIGTSAPTLCRFEQGYDIDGQTLAKLIDVAIQSPERHRAEKTNPAVEFPRYGRHRAKQIGFTFRHGELLSGDQAWLARRSSGPGYFRLAGGKK